MLAQLHEQLPQVQTRIGRAEAIGLPNASVDAIFIGSALHWFDRPAADIEMARVLRPGGIVASFRNRRDSSVAWVRALSDYMKTVSSDDPHHERPPSRLAPAHFGPPEQRAFRYNQPMTADRLAELVSSRSYVIAMEPEQREQVKAHVRELARTHPDLRGHEHFQLPYLSTVDRSVQTLRS